RELRHSRKTVRKALQDAGPWEYRLTRPRPAPKTGPYREIIRQWLLEDRRAPRKQRHTARRIYQRLRNEHGYEGAESTVRRVVAELRRELGVAPVKPYFVLSSDPGEMAQVDWGQAKVMLAGVPTVVHLFCFRLHYSGVAFVWASLHEKLEAFLEGHVRAFAWLGGVVEKIVYDNLTPVVRKILQGHEKRELCQRFVALRSHYLFDSVFANPAAAHEKGSVENLVGYVRRNALTPVPAVDSMDELNALLLAWCEKERERRRTTVGGRAKGAEGPSSRLVPAVCGALPAREQAVAGDLRAQPLFGSHPLHRPDGAGGGLCGPAGIVLPGAACGRSPASHRPGPHRAVSRALS